MGCEKPCCISLIKTHDQNRKVVSLGLVDPLEKKYWRIEASPDFITQCRELKKTSDFEHGKSPDGIFLTHAHIGHYTGLMYLGKESYNSMAVPVFAMTRMKGFLTKNGPWSPLFTLDNNKINNINHQEEIKLSPNLTITQFKVHTIPNFSDTDRFQLNDPAHSVLLHI